MQPVLVVVYLILKFCDSGLKVYCLPGHEYPHRPLRVLKQAEH